MNGMVEIKYLENGREKIRYIAPITERALYHKELMNEEYVLLEFNTREFIRFHKGDYITTDFGTFQIVSIDKPSRDINGHGGWMYQQKFHASWERWKYRKLFYDRQKGSETAWHMTNTPEAFMQIVCDNIRRAGFGDYTFNVDAKLTEMKLLEFDGDDIVSGLNKIAEIWETEWWIDGSLIHLSKCEFGTPVDFERGDVCSEMQRSEGKRSDYVTRLYAFGSSRNIPTNYRKSEDSTSIIEAVVERRLKLPQGIDHIDAWDNMREEDVVEGIAIFEEIYPRRIGTIDSLDTHVYTDEVTDDEHPEGELVDWNAYRFKDNGLTFKSEYILPNVELHIIFQTGALTGMDFAVTFNPDGENENDPKSQVWEIVRNDTYGVDLPNENFHPAVGDTYILYGYDTKMVNDLLIPEAEQELLKEAREYLKKKCIDEGVYSCPTNPIRCAGYLNQKGKLFHNKDEEIDLEIGQSVRLINDNFFRESDGIRLSRIRAFEKRLDNPFNATYQIGETTAYSKTAELTDKIESLTIQNSNTYSSRSGGVYLITKKDKTIPADTNAFSALRSLSEFLRKTQDDSTPFSLSVGGQLKSTDFRQGMIPGEGVGFGFYRDENGNATGEFDNLIIRGEMLVNSLTVNQIKAVGGMTLYSLASIEVIRVEEHDSFYRCFFETKEDYIANLFAEGDIGYCHRFNPAGLNDPEESKNTLKFYKRRVVGIGEDYIDLTKGYPVRQIKVASGTVNDTGVSGSGIPEKGDVIAQFGNYTDANRRYVIVMDVRGGGYIRFLGDLDWVNAQGREYAFQGYQSSTGERHFIGNRKDNQYIEYKDGKLNIPGQLILGSEINSGYSMLDYITDATQDAEKTAREYAEAITKAVGDELQNQIDGKIETWYGEGAPSLKRGENPMIEWEDEGRDWDNILESHSGDLYYDNKTGFAYRFVKENGKWTWKTITDEAITKALAAAGEKKRIFTDIPKPPYDKDDLWVNATYSDEKSEYSYKNDILVCKNGRQSGDFQISDWGYASGYPTEIAGYKYLKDALNGRTEASGGLVLTSLIQLGEWDKDSDILTVWSGINGLYETYGKTGIAAWYGGDMLDIENPPDKLPGSPRWAQSLFRFDGSGYFSGNKIGWRADGSGWLADKNNGIRWDEKGNLYLNNGIQLEGGDELKTLGSIVTFLNNFSINFKPVKINGKTITKLNWENVKSYDDFDAVVSEKGFFSEKFISVSGINTDGGASGGSSTLAGLTDVILNLSTLKDGQSLVYRNGHWVNEEVKGGLTSVSWNDINNKPSWIGSSKPNYTWAEIQNKPTTLSGFGILDELNGLFVRKSGDTMTGQLTVNALVYASSLQAYGGSVRLGTATQQGVLAYEYAGTNYLRMAAEGGYLCIVANGATPGLQNSSLVINESSVFPGNSQSRYLGTDANRWANIYGIKAELRESLKIGNATISWNGDYKCLVINTGLYSEQFISVKGINDGGSSGSGSGGFGRYLTIRVNGERKVYYNGGTEVTADITVPTKVSDLSNNLGFITQSDVAGAFVSALGINGNYLTWTKNGNVNNITVPYATNSHALDNVGIGGFMRSFGQDTTTDLNDMTTSGSYRMGSSNAHTPSEDTTKYANMLVVRGGTAGDSLAQIYFPYNANRVWLRAGTTTLTSGNYFGNREWREFAFTDSNVASADMLSDISAYDAWGQTFFQNGKPVSLSGGLSNVGNINLRFNATYSNGSEENAWLNTYTNNLKSNTSLYIESSDAGHSILFRLGDSESMRIAQPYGYIGMGVTSPAYRLHVAGTIYATESIRIGNAFISWDGDCLKVSTGLYSEKFISVKGINDGGSVGGEILNFITRGTGNGVASVIKIDTQVTVTMGNYLTPDNYQNYITLGNYVTINTEQTLTAIKHFRANISLDMDVDSSRVRSLDWRDISGTSIAKIAYHNVNKNLFLNPQGSAEINNDTVGKYSLRIGVNALTYNTYPILHSNNFSEYALEKNGNAASASRLSGTYTFWGQQFNGTQSVSGNMNNVGDINSSGILNLTYIDASFNGYDAISLHGGLSASGTNQVYLGIGIDKDGSSFIPYIRGISYNGSGADISINSNGGKVAIGKIQASSTLDVGGQIQGSSNLLLGTSTTQSQINFLYGGANYIRTSVANGYFMFIANGKGTAQANAELLIANNVVRPGANATISLGSSSQRWSNIYGVTGNFSNTLYAAVGIWSDGYISAKGQNTSSDERLKIDYKPLNLSLAQIAEAPVLTFRWKKDGAEDFGSIAQYWQKINPLFARTDFNGNLTMDYGKTALCGLITVANKTQNLEQRVQFLEKENQELKRKIETLEKA